MRPGLLAQWPSRRRRAQWATRACHSESDDGKAKKGEGEAQATQEQQAASESSEELQTEDAGDADMEEVEKRIVLTPAQRQAMMEHKLKLSVEEHVPKFVGGMVALMTRELQQQLSGLAAAPPNSDRKLDRVGAVVSELRERLRASEARAQDREEKWEKRPELMRQTVEQLREDKEQARKAPPLAASSSSAAGVWRPEHYQRSSSCSCSTTRRICSGRCAGQRRGVDRSSSQQRLRWKSPRQNFTRTLR